MEKLQRATDNTVKVKSDICLILWLRSKNRFLRPSLFPNRPVIPVKKPEMSVYTLLLDFSVDPKNVKNESHLSLLSSNIENVLRDYIGNLKLITTLSIAGGSLNIYSGDMGSVISLRIFDNGTITVNIEYLKGDDSDINILTLEVMVFELKGR
uniref:Uncharacterized protein n=1 Tax=Photinus pyralis TaxID=7054 RepID=A0A1Y1LW12_PHOPY